MAKKPTNTEIENFVDTYEFTENEIADVEEIEFDDETAINLGYVYSTTRNSWFKKNNSLYTEREEEIVNYLTN